MAETKAAAPAKTPVGKATQQFLQSLHERNASVNTITAYRKDLSKFSEYAGDTHGKRSTTSSSAGFSRSFTKKD